MGEIGNVFIVLGLLYGVLWVMRELVPVPYRFVMRLLHRMGQRLWDVAYRVPAARRGKAFGFFWLGRIVWTLSLLAVLTQRGQGLPGLIVFALFLAVYRVLLGWWERRAAARIQRPLPHREQW